MKLDGTPKVCDLALRGYLGAKVCRVAGPEGRYTLLSKFREQWPELKRQFKAEQIEEIEKAMAEEWLSKDGLA